MSRKKGQTYTAEQKTKIVLEMLKEEMTTSQLASKYICYNAEKVRIFRIGEMIILQLKI